VPDDIAISLQDVSKKYRLFASTRHRMLEAFNPFRKTYHREFWALRNITCDLPKGRTSSTSTWKAAPLRSRYRSSAVNISGQL
jgi:hypothetical protein